MRVLVTGAAGFIGSHVAEALTAVGHEVRWLDSLNPAVHSGKPSYVPDGADFRRADVRDAASVADALDGVEAVCHLAAMVGLGVSLADLPLYADVNVNGTAVLLDAMGRRDVSRLVLSSSMVVYGEGAYTCPSDSCPSLFSRASLSGRAGGGLVRPLPRAESDLEAGVFDPRCPSCGSVLLVSRVPEEAALDPRNAYATSKLAQEHLAANWARLTGGTCVSLRYHNVYGPRMPRDTPYSGVAAIFRSCLENGEPPRVFEDGGQLRDFVHVRDVAQANVLALSATGPAAPGSPTPAGAAFPAPASAAFPAPASAAFPAPAGAAFPVPADAVIPVPAGTAVPYNVASGTPRTVGEMASALATAFGGSVQPKLTGEYRLGDVRHIVASPTAAVRDLGFSACVDFAAGVEEFAHAPLRAPSASR